MPPSKAFAWMVSSPKRVERVRGNGRVWKLRSGSAAVASGKKTAGPSRRLHEGRARGVDVEWTPLSGAARFWRPLRDEAGKRAEPTETSPIRPSLKRPP